MLMSRERVKDEMKKHRVLIMILIRNWNYKVLEKRLDDPGLSHNCDFISVDRRMGEEFFRRPDTVVHGVRSGFVEEGLSPVLRHVVTQF